MIVPRDLWRAKELSISAKAVYVDLLSYSNKEGECFPGITTIANDLYMSRRTVERAIKSLVTSGWLKILSGKTKGTSNHYLLEIKEYVKLSQGYVKLSQRCDTRALGGATPEHHEGIPNNYIDHFMNDPDISKNHNNGIEEKFNKWWEVYPRKVAKVKAKAIFMKLKMSDELYGKIMSSLRAFIAFKRDSSGEIDLKYFPHPTTWLNQRRWEDELPEREKPWNEF
jgi:predicted transcriptional regulator